MNLYRYQSQSQNTNNKPITTDYYKL